VDRRIKKRLARFKTEVQLLDDLKLPLGFGRLYIERITNNTYAYLNLKY
jgi:hypothetical protein